MARMTVSAARAQLPEALATAQREAVVLERYGKPVAVLVSSERYDQLMTALEDAEDVAAYEAALADDAAPSIPWEQVKAELGWA